MFEAGGVWHFDGWTSGGGGGDTTNQTYATPDEKTYLITTGENPRSAISALGFTPASPCLHA